MRTKMLSEFRLKQNLLRCAPDLRLRKQQGKPFKRNYSLRRLPESKLNNRFKIQALLMKQ